MILFRDLLLINWLLATYFQYQDACNLETIILETFEDLFAARIIRDDKALENVSKITSTQIEVGL